MGIVSFSEFVGKSFGEITSPQGKVAKGIQNAVCEVYREYPGSWSTPTNIVSGFQRGFMRSLCGDQSPPPPEPLPECQLETMIWGTFRRATKDPGGICGEDGYWRCVIPGGEENLGNTEPVNIDGVMHIVTKDGVERRIAPANKSTYDNEFFGAPDATLRFAEYSPDCALGSSDAGGDRFAYTKTTFRGTVPDYCDQGGRYPEEVPPPSITKNVTVDFGDSTENFDVTITTNNDNKFNFPVNVDVGGVSVSVGFGDVNIGGGGSGSSGDDGGGGSTTTTFLPSPNANDYVVSPPPGVEEEEELEDVAVEDETIDWVLCEVTTPPSGGKTILHKSAEDTTYFAGYFVWTLEAGGTYYYQETPIRKPRTAFRAPANISGYRAYTVNGAKIVLSQYIQKVENEENG